MKLSEVSVGALRCLGALTYGTNTQFLNNVPEIPQKLMIGVSGEPDLAVTTSRTSRLGIHKFDSKVKVLTRDRTNPESH